jgi:hypothetical protein
MMDERTIFVADAIERWNLLVTIRVGTVILVRAFERSQEQHMSRALLVLSAAAFVCASSFLAVADQKSATANAVARNEVAVAQKSTAKQQRREFRVYRHYRGYDETPSAMIVSSNPA